MDDYSTLIITAAILILPLIPATIIYLILTPKKTITPNTKKKKTKQANNEPVTSNKASGSYEGDVMLGKLRVEFNVVGSSATYAILLISAFFIYDSIHNKNIKRINTQDQQAWLVEVPIRLSDKDNNIITTNNGQMQQVRVDLEPDLIVASANELRFWVIPNKGRFPTARFSIPGQSLNATLDINNIKNKDHDAKTMKSADPVWIELTDVYQ